MLPTRNYLKQWFLTPAVHWNHQRKFLKSQCVVPTPGSLIQLSWGRAKGREIFKLPWETLMCSQGWEPIIYGTSSQCFEMSPGPFHSLQDCPTKIKWLHMNWVRSASASIFVANYHTATALMLSPEKRVDMLNRGGKNNKRLALVRVFAYRNPLKAPHKRCWFHITLPEDPQQRWKMRPGPGTRSPVSLRPGHNIADCPLKCHPNNALPFPSSFSLLPCSDPTFQPSWTTLFPESKFFLSPSGMGSRSPLNPTHSIFTMIRAVFYLTLYL